MEESRSSSSDRALRDLTANAEADAGLSATESMVNDMQQKLTLFHSLLMLV